MHPTESGLPGVVRAIVTVTQAGALVHRTGVNLTTDRERDRFLQKVEGRATRLDEAQICRPGLGARSQ